MEVVEVIDKPVEVIEVTERQVEIIELVERGPQGQAGNGALGYYGAFSDYTTQSIASTTTAYPMTLNTTDESNGISRGTPTSRIVFANNGTYNIQWSGQFQNSNNNDHDVRVWIKKNGNDVTGSTGYISIPSSHGQINGHAIASWNYILTLNAGDYIEFYWSADSTAVTIQTYGTGTNPTTPSTASLIVTAQQVMNLQIGPTGVPTSRTISAGTGLTGGGDLSANRTLAVAYGTTSGTACQGNDSRLSDTRTPSAHAASHASSGSDPLTLEDLTNVAIQNGSITTWNDGTANGLINTSWGGNTASYGGSIDTHGDDQFGAGGSINTSAGGGFINTSYNGGSINTSGYDGLSGGYIATNSVDGAQGGYIDTSGSGGGGGNSGGFINTSNGGGSINTRGTGSIELGITGTRTTLTGTATADRAISLPDTDGTLIVQGGSSITTYGGDITIGDIGGHGGISGFGRTIDFEQNIISGFDIPITPQGNDIEITDATKGVILKSPNSSRWRITVDNDGNLSSTKL